MRSRVILEVPSFPGYFAGNDGTIWSKKPLGPGRPAVRLRRKKATLNTDRRGYKRLTVCLMDGGVRFNRTVASLVLEAFIGPAPAGMQACHFDDDYRNNRLLNLRWDTPKGNADDRGRNGNHICGNRHHAAQLSAQSVKAIKRRLARGISRRSLADQYGVRYQVIERIDKGRNWKHISI